MLPLVPGYLSAVSAVEADRLGERGSARRVVLASIPFVLGFTALFVALGIGAQLIGAGFLSNQFLLERVAGFVLVVFGFAFMGLLPWPERLVGAGLVQGARSRGSRVLLGGAFAICAAPCIGPVLAAILVLAGTSDTVLQGAFLLACYSLGLAIPFVLAGAIFTRAMGAFRWLRDHYVAIQFVSGAIMVALGLLLFFDRFYILRIYLNRALERSASTASSSAASSAGARVRWRRPPLVRRSLSPFGEGMLDPGAAVEREPERGEGRPLRPASSRSASWSVARSRCRAASVVNASAAERGSSWPRSTDRSSASLRPPGSRVAVASHSRRSAAPSSLIP